MNWFNLAVNGIIGAVRGVAVLCYDKLKYNVSYTAIDFADDELITKRGVAGMIAGAGVLAPISIPAGSAIPFLIDMTVAPYLNVIPGAFMQVELFLDGTFATATKTRIVYDVQVEKDFTDDTRSQYSQVQVFGYPDDIDPTITQNALQLIIR